jgi:hypothetical protein
VSRYDSARGAGRAARGRPTMVGRAARRKVAELMKARASSDGGGAEEGRVGCRRSSGAARRDRLQGQASIGATWQSGGGDGRGRRRMGIGGDSDVCDEEEVEEKGMGHIYPHHICTRA